MFEKVLPRKTLELADRISSKIAGFYLAGGTGLALQLGHRKSEDLDFFSPDIFNTDLVLERLRPDKTFVVKDGTIHSELKNIKISFLYYKQPLIYPTIQWQGLKIADWRDITAEKLKTISQRGAKKDFYDLYAALQMKISIPEACKIFKTRFASSGINQYHVVKSLVYFEEAESDPRPLLTGKAVSWKWETVKNYFQEHLKQFQEELT